MKRNGIKIKTIICGLLFVAAGALLVAFNAGALPLAYKTIIFSWPMLLVAIGFINLFSRHGWFFGIVLMALGGFFLLPKLGIEQLVFISHSGWAIALVIIGVIILCKAVFGRRFFRSYNGDYSGFHFESTYREGRHKGRRNRYRENHGNESGYIERNCIFGGGKEKPDIKNFNGGEINCVFGGIELDLSDSRLAEGVHYLELNSIFGGVVLYVPVEWNVQIKQTQVFGRFEDHRPKPGFEIDEKSILIVEANSVFGGGEIKCKDKSAHDTY